MNFLELARTNKERWFSQALNSVNGNTVSIRVMRNFVADFHQHQDSDEMFIVLGGALFIDCEDQCTELQAGDTYVVNAGSRHRARVPDCAELITIMKKV